MQVGCDLLTPSPGHNVTGQRKQLGREWEACALVYSGLPSPPGFTMHGLPPKLLVSSVNTVLEVAHTPVHHRAVYSQCHPGDSERDQKTSCRGRGELMSAVRIFTVHSQVDESFIALKTARLCSYYIVIFEQRTTSHSNDGKKPACIPRRPHWAVASGELWERWWSPMRPWTSWAPLGPTRCTTSIQSAWTAPWWCYGSCGLRLCCQCGPKSTKVLGTAWASYFTPCRYTEALQWRHTHQR